MALVSQDDGLLSNDPGSAPRFDLGIIPAPRYIQPLADSAITTDAVTSLVLVMEEEEPRLRRAVRAHFPQTTAIEERADDDTARGYALLTHDNGFNPAQTVRLENRIDAYHLRVDGHGIALHANSAAALFYGIKTIAALMRLNHGVLPAVEITDWAELTLRADYLDLRTIYPRHALLVESIAEMASYKINTLVIEYEDRLPFDTLDFLRHPDLAMSRQELDELLHTAHENFVQVIPKQQSFGHLEYILKHPQFIHLRETPESIGELCPLREGSFAMMASILDEVMHLHPHSRFMHIGCDEVWSLGTCDACRASGKSRASLFIDFVNQLASHVLLQGRVPIIWHDMLAHATAEELRQLDRRIIVVVWIYGGYAMPEDATQMVERLRSAGLQVWGASSVRCWDDDGAQNFPLLHRRMRNIRAWVEVAQRMQIPALINTNWSTPFGLGSPYGLYETARYPAIFAAEQCWNPQADVTTFLARFLRNYHEVDAKECSLAPSADMTDYYEIVSTLLPGVQANRDTALLIDLVRRYEYAAKRHLPMHTYLFRLDLPPVGEDVKTSLHNRYLEEYVQLAGLREEMRAFLSNRMAPAMVEVYIASRFFLLDLYAREYLKRSTA